MSGGYFDRSTYAMRDVRLRIVLSMTLRELCNRSRRKLMVTIGLFTRKIALVHTIVIKTT